MKKILALTLALCMLFALTACSAEPISGSVDISEALNTALEDCGLEISPLEEFNIEITATPGEKGEYSWTVDENSLEDGADVLAENINTALESYKAAYAAELKGITGKWTAEIDMVEDLAESIGEGMGMDFAPYLESFVCTVYLTLSSEGIYYIAIDESIMEDAFPDLVEACTSATCELIMQELDANGVEMTLEEALAEYGGVDYIYQTMYDATYDGVYEMILGYYGTYEINGEKLEFDDGDVIPFEFDGSSLSFVEAYETNLIPAGTVFSLAE